jgi:exodeoxyribonuclease V alpha subunit
VIPDETVELDDMDVHFGRTLARLAGGGDALALAAAVASRATAEGDVCARLADYAGRALEPFAPAPPLDPWTRLLRDVPAVGTPGEARPLVLDEHGRLYLYRYWNYERRVGDDLIARAVEVEGVSDALLREGLRRYFPDAGDVEQKLAAAAAVLRRFCVISGGPGTGKTTTVVKILVLLAEQAQPRKLAVGVAAPTGKAAARVQDAIRAALDKLDVDLFVREAMPREAFTIHRLLGTRPDSIAFRHDRDNPLAFDVLVIDEASMADIALFAKLVDALPARTRLVLLGDKDQLASVEAGAVLGDICAESGGRTAAFAKRLASVSGVPASKIARAANGAAALGDSVALLERSYRFGAQSGIGALARAVNAGRGEDALDLLKGGAHADIAWRTITAGELRGAVADSVPERYAAYFEAVRDDAPPHELFRRFNAFRVLCAHRRGLTGAVSVNRIVEETLDQRGYIAAGHTWYAGRPVMITRNDYNLKLFNGDIGIALPDPAAPDRLQVCFVGAGDTVRRFAPSRLPEHETVYAMTVHKSQGSEFGEALMLLPPEPSRVVTRELVYTGITRAISRVEIWGNEAAFAEAVALRLTRASALAERLWQR